MRFVSALAAALHVGTGAAVTAAPAVQRETVGLMVVAVLVLLMALMRLVLLPAGDEGRQPVDITIGGCVALRAWVMLLALLMLRETWFTPTGWGEALYVPPIARTWFLRSAVAWERAGATISAPFAGVHIVEATKQVYRAIPARRQRARLVPALEPALVPSPGR